MDEAKIKSLIKVWRSNYIYLDFTLDAFLEQAGLSKEEVDWAINNQYIICPLKGVSK